MENESKERIVRLLEPLAVSEGSNPSNLDDVRILKVSEASPRGPSVYDPSIVFVGQGRKIGYLGDETYTYDPDNYLVLSVPLPFECETAAEPGKPFLALSVRVDPGVLGELTRELDEDEPKSEAVRGLYSTPVTPDLRDAVKRLLEVLQSPVESRILGPAVLREITYRVLRGERGGALKAVAARHTNFGRIARILDRMHRDYSREWSVQTLADEVHMSPSAFHHAFKAVTSTSPLQYLKSIRLHEALLFMTQDGMNAGKAADRVGYASRSQFSREFKRFFGKAPKDVLS